MGKKRWALVALFAILAIAVLSTWGLARRVDRELRRTLLLQARLVAQAVNVDCITALTGTEADLASPDYQRLKQQLTAVRSANPQCRFVYLMGRATGDVVFFFVDSEPTGSQDYSPPGQVYDEVTEALRRAFDVKAAAVEGPVSDRWGTWVSALVPITDPHSGGLLAVLGMDIDAHDWRLTIAARAALPAGLLLVLLIGVASLLVAARPVFRRGAGRRVDAAPKPIMRRLLPFLACMLIVLTVGAGVLLWQQYRQRMSREIAADIADISADLRTALDQQASGLTVAAQTIAADAAVQKALRAHDASRLLADWRPMFETLHRQNHLTHLYFFDTNRICLLRVHQPERRGDRIEHFTAIETERTGKTAFGIELGARGTFTLRVVQPVFEGGVLIGYVELGKEIEDALHTLHARSDIQLAVVIRKKYLSRQRWEAGMRLLGQQADWDRLPRSAVIYTSQGRLPDAFASWADQMAATHTHRETDREITVEGKAWRVSATPLQDASGNEVGDLLVMRDISAEKAAFAQLMTLSGTACGVVLALLLGFIYVLLRRTDAGICAQQEELRESEERFAQLAEQSATIAWEVDAQGLYTYVSQVSKAVLGYRPDELVGRMHFYDLHPEAGREAFKEAAFAVFARKELFQNLVNAAQTKNGRHLWFTTNGFPLLNADGTLRGYCGSDTDITARKRAEQALRESEERYRIILEQAGDAIFLHDTTGRILDINQKTCQCLGYSREELLSKFIGDIDPEAIQAKKNTAWGKILAGEQVTFESHLRRKDGRAIPVEVTLGSVRLPAGPVIIGIARDITERKRIAEALQQEQILMLTLMDNLPDHIYFKDTASRFLRVNPALATLFGVRNPADVVGKSDADFFSAEHAQEALIVEQTIMRTGQPMLGIEEKETWPDGHESWVLSSKLPLRNPAGNIIGTCGISSNISARKHAEAEKVKLETQNRQLQKSESLGRMAGAIAHHFNNQLMAVMGNLELVMQDLPQGAEPFATLSAAMQAARQAAEVSRLMLIYIGQTPAAHALLDLSETCRQNLPVLRAGMPENVVLETDLPSPGPAINANANQLNQILANLLTNTWEAIGAGGGVIHLAVTTVSAADMPVAYQFPVDWQPQEQAYACIAVADTGGGIAHPDMEKIVDPFFSTKFTGRGLGLSVVMGIVRAHEGCLTVASEAGQGSTFRVFLPLSIQAPAGTQSPATELEAGGPLVAGTILVVEDDEALRKLTTRMLTRLGIAVVVAQDGVEALELFRQRQADIQCVLCDLTMPRMDGWATLTALRAIRPGLPVILASGYDEEQVMAGDHPERPQAFLGKPYEMQSLRDAIAKALGRE